MIKGWLTTAMQKEIRNSVKYAKTAAEIWKDLKERFGKESAPKAYELKQSLAATRQDGTTVSAYYTRLRVLWDEMESILPTPRCTCDGRECGLGKKLTELKAMKPTPDLNAAYHLVAEDEQQRTIASSKGPVREVAAFQTSFQGRREQTRNQQEKGWTKNKRGFQADKTEQCSECGRDGHDRSGCLKIIRYPEWWPGKGKGDKPRPKTAMVETKPCPIPGMTEEQYAMFLKLFGENREEPVDSGATEHITRQRHLLKNLFMNTIYSIPIPQYDEPHEELAKNMEMEGSSIQDNEEEQTHNVEDVLEDKPEDLIDERENVQSGNIHAENIHMESHVEPPVVQQEIEEGRPKRQRTQPRHFNEYQLISTFRGFSQEACYIEEEDDMSSTYTPIFLGAVNTTSMFMVELHNSRPNGSMMKLSANESQLVSLGMRFRITNQGEHQIQPAIQLQEVSHYYLQYGQNHPNFHSSIDLECKFEELMRKRCEGYGGVISLIWVSNHEPWPVKLMSFKVKQDYAINFDDNSHPVKPFHCGCGSR
ncbi:reverse transcriptase, RNA-dependent DNA polymerase, Gag-polypeptide of LTR copia-type [Artemisia annua]|uniref:Reverse transcriptase, RNA-dependent DNA polymerase, Gag-polypeptide of LTR copia-type n=1 Tax=Artemisia annua TaxID=35608 RepID=A0A2U1LKD2_ARTAN|nr:reverse transcriptase, RNA-dependent DNA polymerase, Gag-polypeptide of LTR copia-type [Artemisia annua]